MNFLSNLLIKEILETTEQLTLINTKLKNYILT